MIKKSNNEDYTSAKGTRLIFRGSRERLAKIEKVLEFYLHKEYNSDGNLLAYYDDDSHLCEIDYLIRKYEKLIAGVVIKKRANIILNDVLPAKLEKFDNKSWKEIYSELSLDCGDEDSESEFHYSQGGGIAENMRSINEIRVNGYT